MNAMAVHSTPQGLHSSEENNLSVPVCWFNRAFVQAEPVVLNQVFSLHNGCLMVSAGLKRIASFSANR